MANQINLTLDSTGRAAPVTGGAVGIGLGIARQLPGFGAKVAIVDVDIDGAAAYGAAKGGVIALLSGEE